jgi:hypothetical protein
MYANRPTIELINALKSQWGVERFSQCNSRNNGSFINHVRLYATAADKQAKRNYRELTTVEEIRRELSALKGA